MASYIISGDCDDVCAKLKTTLKAQDAKFEATLQSQFNVPAAPPRKPVAAAPPMPARKPVAAVAAPAGKPTFSTGSLTGSSTGSLTGSLLSSNRNTDDSLRGRLRTSLRSTPSR